MRKPRQPKAKGAGRIVSPPSVGIDPNTQLVVFGFKHIVRGFDLSGADVQDGHNLVDALRLRCSITWAQIIGSPRQKLGCEKIAAALKVEIPDALPNDKRESLQCFRFGGDVERFIGYRHGSTFEIVWIDCKFIGQWFSCYDAFLFF